jgi:hypothetical protein
VARGATLNGVQVHPVRTPGFVIGIEAIFGAHGQRLHIRHESGESAEPYVGGALLAIRRVHTLEGVHRGLDALQVCAPLADIRVSALRDRPRLVAMRAVFQPQQVGDLVEAETQPLRGLDEAKRKRCRRSTGSARSRSATRSARRSSRSTTPGPACRPHLQGQHRCRLCGTGEEVMALREVRPR